MKSFISLVLRLNLDVLSILIIGDEYGGTVDKCALNGAANLLPGLLFSVEFEIHDKHDHFVDVYGDVPLLT